MKSEEQRSERYKEKIQRMALAILMVPMLLFISCDGDTDLPGTAYDLDETEPPSLANIDGPMIHESAPSPCVTLMGPEKESQVESLTSSSFDEQGLPIEHGCKVGDLSPQPGANNQLLEHSSLFEEFNKFGFFEDIEINTQNLELSQSQSVPGAATLSSPSGSINSAAPQFQWQAVSGATWYYVWVRDSGTMDTSGSPRIAHWITASDAGCGSGSGTCSWYADKNLESGDAKWWIRTWNSAGYGPWSSAMDFTVSGSINLPAAVTLNSPDSDVSTSRPTFSWNSVSGATWYYVWVRDSETMNFSGDPRIKQWVSASQAGCSGGGVCSWEANTDIVDGNATWWVQSWNASGFGGWSSGMQFSVNEGSGPPAKAELTSPDNVINNVRPEFQWQAVSNADWYWVWVRDSNTMDFSGNPRIKKWVTAEDAGCGDGTGTCSWQADTDLWPGDAKFWVQTWNYAAGYGPWSDAMDFHYEMVFAGVVSPNIALENTSRPVFEWTAVKNIGSYLIGVEDEHGVSFNKFITPAEANCASGIGTCTWESDRDLGRGIVDWGILTYFQDFGGPGFNVDTYLGSFAINLFSSCQDILTDINGNHYQTAQLKGQCWTRENLVVTRFNNGDFIQYVSPTNTWSSYNSPARVLYDNHTDNREPFGYLYNWYAASDDRNLCPTDWRVPSDDDWKNMEQLAGMSASELDDIGVRGEGANVGGWMKEPGTDNWSSPNTGATFGVGFDALPNGSRSQHGEFSQQGILGYYWSSSEYQYRALGYNHQGVIRQNANVRTGMSVRCVTDN